MNDGGPAFPRPSGPEPRVDAYHECFDGMSLRDYFMAADFTEWELSQVVYRLHPDEPSIDETHESNYVVPLKETAKRFAEARLILADALLKARGQ